MVLITGRAFGLSRIRDFQHIEHDPLLASLFDLPKLPDITSLYRELIRFGRDQVAAALGSIGKQVVSLSIGKEVVLDIDSTVETVYGHQEGAAVGYNPAKRGRASFHPQLCFDGLTRTVLDAELRPGNTASNSGLTETVARVLDETLKDTVVRLVRGDRGYGNEDFMSFLEKRNIPYILKTSATRPLRAWSDTLTYRTIGEVPDGVLEIASGIYSDALAWTKPRRVVVLRERHTGMPKGLFPMDAISDERFIVTTEDWDEEDVFHSYNHRCTVETTIRTLKDDWALDAFSSRSFAANAADMQFKVMAYNLLLIMQTLVAPKDRGVVHTAATLRRMWFLLPAVMSSHAGHWQLRLPMYAETGPYAHARQALRVLNSSA